MPYHLHANGVHIDGIFKIKFVNSGAATAVFQVRSGNDSTGPWTYTVEPEATLSDKWQIGSNGKTAYDLSVYGPNGFFRLFKGGVSDDNDAKANLEIKSLYNKEKTGIALDIHNRSKVDSQVPIVNVYTRPFVSLLLEGGSKPSERVEFGSTHGWYDLKIGVESDPTFHQQFAGHVETGGDSMTDPAIGLSTANV